MNRNIKDALLVETKYLPAAGATNYTDAFDLGAKSGGYGEITPEGIEIEIAVPALPALVDDKTVTFQVQDSADNSTFTDLGMSFVRTGAGGAGAATITKKFPLPVTTRRYVRVSQTVLAAGGDNTGVQVTASLCF